MNFWKNVICPPYVTDCKSLAEIDLVGLLYPKSAIALEAWMIPTLIANTAFYFSSRSYFQEEDIYTGANLNHNNWLIGLDATQICLNIVAISIMNYS